ncbi:BatA domain-containing protein [Tundrisphaera lichenicola]|uniref:BatA domain-containing protein n=1 Tax=Tundrisphaera lichenicola TaxID=2029860 RepID=UPI003EB8C28A
MGWGVLNAAMLLGLAGVAIPLVIHLLNRRNDPVVDWAAMQFLEFSPREQRRLNLAEILLMLSRMALLALVALALARPFWTPRAASASSSGANPSEGSATRRDVVLILDESDAMARQSGGSTPRARAIAWSRAFVKRLRAGDSVAVLAARDRVQPLVDPPSFDLELADQALANAPPARGSGDLASALGEAFRILERTGNPARDVVILSDGRRTPWKPGERARWSLLRDLRARMPVPPRIWAASFEGPGGPDESAPDGSVGPLELSRSVLTPGLPVEVTAAIANAGPGPMTRPVELVIDGKVVPGSSRVVGPIPAGSKTPVSFRAEFDRAGSHLIAVRLAPDSDPLTVDDEAARPVTVASALPVLLVDGEPGLEPLSGEADFLRAALAPTGDPSPLVLASTVEARDLQPQMFQARRVVVLANPDRIGPEQAAALGAFVESGGGLLIAPGDRIDADAFNERLARDGKGWLPARIGPLRGNFEARSAVAHPDPRTFDGPTLGPLGRGDAPALGEADLFAYRVLEPAPGAIVSARLDTGDPWLVERPFGKGRVALLAGPIDAEGGTLPVSPDFVPWAHELIAHLAAGLENPNGIRPGEPLTFELDPAPNVETLTLTTPSGNQVRLPVKPSGNSARVRTTETGEPGIYRLDLPEPPGGSLYAAVAGDDRNNDPSPLEPPEAEALARGWPLSFETDPARMADRLLAVDRARRSEVWHALILGALAALCVEVWLTRQMARRQPGS